MKPITKPRATRLSLALSCACAITAIASLAHAERFEIGLGSASRWTHSPSVLTVHDSSSTGLTLDAAVRWTSIAGFDLLTGASFVTDTAWATTFQRMRTATTTQVALVGARVRRHLLRHWLRDLSLHGRVAVGPTRVSAELRDLASGSQLADRGYGAAAYLGAGLDFVPLHRRAADGGRIFSLGVRAELGYLAMTAVGLDARSPDTSMPEGTIEIPTRAAALGHLDMSALTLRVALLARF